MAWDYEVGYPRKHKDHWNQVVPGFVKGPGGQEIGKCPHHLGPEDCQWLINQGIEYRPTGWDRDYPQRIYVIFEGNLYRAVPTVPGRSYHGFPEPSSQARRLPKTLKVRILARADELGCREEIERCLSGR